MKDKILPFIFLLFVGISIYGYDRIQVNKGENGPIGWMITFLGLDQTNPQSKIVQKGLNTTFDFRAPDRFAKLNVRLGYVDNQLNETITNRKKILNQLLEVNERLKEVSKSSFEQLAKERRPHLESNYRISEFNASLIDTHTLSDADLRLDRYRVIESQLMSMIEESVNYVNSDVTRLKNILYRIEMLVMESDELVVGECDGYQSCLEKRNENILEELSFIFEPVLKKEGRQLEKYKELMGLWEQEYYLQLNNIDEHLVVNRDTKRGTVAALQRLTNQLVRISSADLKTIIYTHKTLNFEYQNIIGTLQNDHKRRTENTEFLLDQLRKLMDTLEFSDQMNFDQMINQIGPLLEHYERLHKELIINDDEFVQVIKHQLFEYQQFMLDVGQMMSVDVKRLLEDNTYAEAINRAYVHIRHRMKQVEARKQ